MLSNGSYLVTDALAGDFPLKLSEGKQDVQGQPAHRGGRIELPGNGNKAHAPGIERLNDLGKNLPPSITVSKPHSRGAIV
jgi:hypothetical protein